MKRFTESTKWDDKWFRRLPANQKFAWLYLLDTCDAAGVVDIDQELAEFRIGMPVDMEGLVKASEGRIEAIGRGKHWIVGYIAFQYGRLSNDCNAHRPAFASLEKHQLTSRVLEGIGNPSLKGPILDKDKDKDKNNTPEGGCKGETRRFVKPTLAQVSEYCRERDKDTDAGAFVDFYESKGWKVGNQPMRDWKAAVRNWERGGNRGSPRNGLAAVVSYADLREPET